jgi:hypothetical protein
MKKFELDPERIEEMVNEVRGLLHAHNLIFLGECDIGDEEATNIYFAVRVIREKFEDLATMLGYDLSPREDQVHVTRKAVDVSLDSGN